MSEDWDELLDLEGQKPVWRGAVRVESGIKIWWRAWRTARLEVGVMAEYPAATDDWADAYQASWELLDGIALMLAGELRAKDGYMMQVTPPAEYTGWTPRREFTRINGKVAVVVSDGRMLEGCINVVERFARGLEA
jgi:hypothetical protein